MIKNRVAANNVHHQNYIALLLPLKEIFYVVRAIVNIFMKANKALKSMLLAGGPVGTCIISWSYGYES